jgi:AcrR family transcriptional regulator
MGRPRLHDEKTERELLAAAERLLAEGGAQALSVRRLAEAARTTSRAIYSVFGGKEGLLRALFREAFRELSATLDALPLSNDPSEDLIAAGAQGFRSWARAHPDLFRLAFEEGVAPVQAVDTEAGVQAFGRLVARARRCVDAGLLPVGSETEVALGFHALCEGLASLEARGRFPPFATRDPRAVWDGALRAVVKGYRA